MFSLGAFILITIGILLVVADLFMGTVALLWFGIGFVIVGIVEFFYPINYILYELLASFSVSGILMLAFNKEVKNWIAKSDYVVKDDFLNESGIGEIQDGMVNFKGTYWEYYSESGKKYDEGTKVKVNKTKDNIAYLD